MQQGTGAGADPTLINVRRLLDEWAWLADHKFKFRVKPPTTIGDDVLYHPYPVDTWFPLGAAVAVTVHVCLAGTAKEVAILNFARKEQMWAPAWWWKDKDVGGTSGKLVDALAGYMNVDEKEDGLMTILTYLRLGPVRGVTSRIIFSSAGTGLYALRNQAEQLQFSADGGVSVRNDFYLQRQAEWDLCSPGPDSALRTTLVLRHA
jgi:hypothetical protein